jgi:hypothetical protein
MPAEVVEEPLGISCVFPNGTSTRRLVGGTACPRLARDLVTGLAGLVHPHGRIGSRSSIDRAMTAVRRLTAALEAKGFSGGASGLSRAALVEFFMGAAHADEQAIRAMLASWDTDTAGLGSTVRDLVDGRSFNAKPSTRPLAPYTEHEWSRLVTTCRTMIDTTFAAHRAALTAARRGEDPGSPGWTPTPDNVRRLLAAQGPVSARTLTEGLGLSQQSRTLVSRGLREACPELFPQPNIVIAYQLLFGAYTGIVPDGIDGLGVGDLDWAGDASILLSYIKGRTAGESLTLSGQAVRLLERWLEHSDLLRGFAAAGLREQLWLRHRPNTAGRMEACRVSDITVRAWTARHGLTDDSGQPLVIHRQRIRTTFHTRRDRRAWHGSGRATIDPNHGPRVEGDHYLTVGTATQRDAVEAIIEDAQADLLARARPPVVVAQEDVVALVRDYPGTIRGLALDDTAIAELVGGERDVFTAACADQLSGIHGPKGAPCPARPWVCLLCPLAVFAPRHATNLLRLKAFFTRQWRQMPAEQFMAVFGPYADRVEQILDRFDHTVLVQATVHVRDTDDELPLRPEEHTR